MVDHFICQFVIKKAHQLVTLPIYTVVSKEMAYSKICCLRLEKKNWIEFKGLIPGAKVLPDEAATFIITSKKIEKDESYSSSSDEDISESSDPKWDKVLDDYEEYVDKYIKIIEK